MKPGFSNPRIVPVATGWAKNSVNATIFRVNSLTTHAGIQYIAFYDENARLIHDLDHSDSEERFILLGLSYKLRIILVIHCYYEDESIIRIISARKASKHEQNQYGEFLKMTTFGQQVLFMDTTGNFANSGKQEISIKAIPQYPENYDS